LLEFCVIGLSIPTFNFHSVGYLKYESRFFLKNLHKTCIFFMNGKEKFTFYFKKFYSFRLPHTCLIHTKNVAGSSSDVAVSSSCLAESSCHVAEYSCHVVKSNSHLEESRSHVAESSSYVVESSRFSRVFRGVLRVFNCFLSFVEVLMMMSSM
jgi:hypothetical protein